MTPAELAERLATWFAGAARDLPWRRSSDPWAILLSEVLLQQTRVETVAPRFAELLATIPTPAACAALDDAALHQLWQGLGYYRRARALRAAAQRIVAEHGGQVPADPAALAALPGVGPYTTGAVAAIAFDMPVPAVDGNVVRVWARFHGRRCTPTEARTPATTWLSRLYRHGSPRTLLQAVMELGATLCTPRRPRCAVCPLGDGCRATRWPEPTATPLRETRPRPPIERLTHAWLRRGDELWLEHRPKGLLGERPAPPVLPAPPPEELSLAGIRARLRRTAAPYRHAFTHRRWHVFPALYEVEAGDVPSGWHRIPVSGLETAGLPTAFLTGWRRLLEDTG